MDARIMIDLVKRTLGGLAQPVLAFPRLLKRSIAVLVDVTLCVLTVWLAYYLVAPDLFVTY